VSFESRRYSVPFAWVRRQVEIRGTAEQVVILAEGQEIARHPRHTRHTLVLEPTHYEGTSTAAVSAPTPLGRRARLQLAAGPHTALLPPPEAVVRPLHAVSHAAAEGGCRDPATPTAGAALRQRNPADHR
jgi:hypothetical protein